MSSTPAEPLAELPITFSIAGAQKAATTTLSQMLDRHAKIRRAPRKELAIFDDESRDWSRPVSFTRTALTPGQVHMGDATPTYLWWPHALERLHAANPDARVIALFRDPIERLFSHWVMNTSRWPRVARDWPDFITRFRPDHLETEIPAGVNLKGYRLNSGVVRGYYGAQLRRAHEIFGAEQVKALEFHDFLGDHRRVLDELTDFLGIHRYRNYPPLANAFAGRPQTFGTAPTAADIDGLVDLYRDDHAAFRELSGLDTSRWSLHRILEGSLTSAELAERFAAKIAGPFDRLREATAVEDPTDAEQPVEDDASA